MRQLDMKVNGPTSDRVYKAAVYEVKTNDPDISLSGKPAGSGVYEIEINPAHPVFQSSSFQVIDAVLAQFGHYVTQEENARGVSTPVSFGDMLSHLRIQFRADNSVDPNRLAYDMTDVVNRVQSALTKSLSEEQQNELLALLSPASANRVQLAQARGGGGARKPVSSLIKLHDLAQVFQQRPELIMASGCFKEAWEPAGVTLTAPLLEEYQENVRRRIGGLLDALSGFEPSLEDQPTPTTLFFIRSAIDMFNELLA